MHRKWLQIILAALLTGVLAGAASAQEEWYEGTYDVDENDYDSYEYDYDDYDAAYNAEYGQEQVDWSEYEWEPDRGLHEEEWYDPSDWFDWDEGVEYEDYGTYGYDDWGYRDVGYDEYRYGYGDYGYDYGDYDYVEGYEIYDEYDYDEDAPDYDYETYGDYDLYDDENYYTDDWYEAEDEFGAWYQE